MTIMFLVKIIIFIVVSIVITMISWKAFQEPGSHGIYRFFAWEAILILIIRNFDYWFYEPWHLNQIISWTMLVLSLLFVYLGVQSLRKIGKPGSGRVDSSLVGIEKTTELVTEGIYAYIRHPLYSSLLFLTWGTFFKIPSWIGGFIGAVATVFLFMTAKIEESENIIFFGDPYLKYMQTTKMFIPFIY